MFRDRDGTIYGVDDGGHAVYQFNSSKELVRTWGTKNVPSDSGCVNKDYKTIQRAAGPFNYPTRLVAECKRTSDWNDAPSRVSILDRTGHLISQLCDNGSHSDMELGSRCAHGLCVDSNGDLYVSEVVKKLQDSFYGVRKYRRV